MLNLLDRKITFGGEIVPAYIAAAPNPKKPARKMKVYPIPGSNKEVVEMEDAWECYDQPYTLFVGDGTQDSIEAPLNDVARVLYKNGWQILLDDYDPEHYRLAYFKGPFDIDNKKTRVAKFDISFRCRAERFLIIGNTPIPLATGDKIKNPTAYVSKPLIHIEGSGSGTLTVGSTTISFTDMVDYLNLDCETQDCFRLPAENRNNLMSGEFPVLKQGDNIVSFTGGITSVTITPKWWEI